MSSVRHEVAAGILFGIGFAAFGGAWLVRHEQSRRMVEPPDASGELGTVLVYAQQPNGPVRLQPGRPRTLSRPQALAFQLSSTGTGPRLVRIELEAAGRRGVLHEERLLAPADQEMVDHIIDLGDELPDGVELIVALEAPHTFGYESRYPIRLVGSAKRARGTATSTAPRDLGSAGPASGRSAIGAGDGADPALELRGRRRAARDHEAGPAVGGGQGR